ncbi:MAG: YdcF family protein [Candidatus Nanopelagicales bacterium]
MSAPSPASAVRSRASGAAAAARMPRTARGVTTAAATLVVALGLLLPIGAVLQIVLTAQVDDRTRTQAIVVLDAGRVWGDPGPVLRARLAHAADLYRAGVAPVVVLTGPQRAVVRGRAELMADGVPGEDIVGFTTGADTVGAFQVIAGVMRDLGWSAATVVTDPAHAARAQATAAAVGIDAHLSPTDEGTGTALTSEYVGKETIALLRFYLVTRWSLLPIVPQA